MDSQPPEGEGVNPELHIKLNQKFNPFPANNKTPHSEYLGVEQYQPLRKHILKAYKK